MAYIQQLAFLLLTLFAIVLFRKNILQIKKNILLGKFLVQEGYLTEQELVPILTELFGGVLVEKKRKKLARSWVFFTPIWKVTLALLIDI
mgnify:CR=1 FL=1